MTVLNIAVGVTPMFKYPDGEEMMAGDEVLVDGRHKARVELIVIPGTPSGNSFSHIKVPTFFLRREDIGLVEEDNTDFDLVLLSRSRG